MFNIQKRISPQRLKISLAHFRIALAPRLNLRSTTRFVHTTRVTWTQAGCD